MEIIYLNNAEIIEKIQTLKKIISDEISNEILLSILFEMGRYFDKQLTHEIQQTQKQINKIFNQNERKLIRQYYYYNRKEILRLP